MDEILISQSLEETVLYLEKLAGPFEFRSEETMVISTLDFEYLYFIFSMKDYWIIN